MTRAPMSASCRVANGALTACSSATTTMPVSGRVTAASGNALEQGGKSLPAADAHGLEAVALLAPGEFVQQRGQDAPARRADRVPQRDAGAVDVEAVEVGRGDAAQGGRLTVGVTLPEDDVVDQFGIDAGALDDRGDHGGAQGSRLHVFKHAAVAAYRGADWCADDGVGHGAPQ